MLVQALHGLDDVALAHSIVTVPINPEFGSLNLAQAVILLAYEWSKGAELAQPTAKQAEPPAEHGEVDAGAEIPAFAAEDGDARCRRGIDPLGGLADFLPHGGVHGVGLVRAVQAHGGNVIFQRDFERFKLHAWLHS